MAKASQQNPLPYFIRITVFLLIIAVTLSSSCVKLALRFSQSIFDDFSQSFLQECDPQLAREALPGQLKLAEALLQEAPGNKKILASLCTGYTGYALLFVEEGQPARASNLYLRGLQYGLKSLGVAQSMIKGGKINEFLERLSHNDLSAIFWTTVAWLRWISLNLDKPSALAQMPLAVTALKYVMNTDPNYFYGVAYAIMGCVLVSQGSSLGADLSTAREYFEKALQISKKRLFLVQFLYARYYAVAKQDRDLFRSLLEQVVNGSPSTIKEVCLVNQVMKQRAKVLLESMDEFFV
ncbi:MAG: hypothetical protein JRI39_03130 [Deltaproteobacteria bacterium]|nr:hypothetical protein [Deltaproteobacteria bacterium]MBW2082093.1 hypothetical protein [Deltaproteobacteria bacterium]HDM10294.1 hypothetical protein [Desulfobacteraceae bacterium]